MPRATFDYLSSLEWVRAAENVCLIGPAGTGKSHLLLALGLAAVDAGHRVRYYTAAELLDSLYRGLADNSVGKIIDGLLRYDLIIVDLCRHRDYAEATARCRLAASASWSSVLGIVTGSPGTRVSCRLAGSGQAWPSSDLSTRGPVP